MVRLRAFTRKQSLDRFFFWLFGFREENHDDEGYFIVTAPRWLGPLGARIMSDVRRAVEEEPTCIRTQQEGRKLTVWHGVDEEAEFWAEVAACEMCERYPGKTLCSAHYTKFCAMSGVSV